MRFIDVSGFGHSGKTVVTDHLKQYEEIFAFPNHVEFELFRVAGGLADLYLSIYGSWNLIRSTVRINEFRQLVKRIGTVQTSSDPLSYFTASGHGYNQYFNNRFIEISNKLIDNIITGKQTTYWPYEYLRISPFSVFLNKLKTRLNKTLITTEICYSDRDTFIDHIQNYMQELFAELHLPATKTHILLNNAFEPFDPSIGLDMVGAANSIIVDRDPRDIYASQINIKDVYVPEFERNAGAAEVKRQMTGFKDIDQFIFRYRTIKNNINKKQDSRVLWIRYEDFLTDHEAQSEKLNAFVGLPANAKKMKTSFNVADSAKNMGLWKKYRDLPEIKLIEKELSDFCYQA